MLYLWFIFSIRFVSFDVVDFQTLDIVAEHPDKFKVVALAAGSNVTLLADQVTFYHLQLQSRLTKLNLFICIKVEGFIWR